MMQCSHVYYHILEGNQFIFADERIKKMVLDLALVVQKEENWSICAFCITNESAYFVTEARDQDSVTHGMKQLCTAFLEHCPRRLPGWQSPKRRMHVCMPVELVTQQEVGAYCRSVHRIPLERGYVCRLDDYWWSSYITYAGIYDWELVDCRRFNDCYMQGRGTPMQKLRQFHSDKYQVSI